MNRATVAAGVVAFALVLAACGGGTTKHTAAPTTTTELPTPTTPISELPTSTVPPATTTLPPTTTTLPPTTTTTTAPLNGLTGIGATIGAWNRTHSRDPNYEGFAAYGPIVTTPEGPTPQYIEVQNDGSNITQFIESLPNGTSLASAKQIALQSLPSDITAVSFVVSDQNGSCGFWNLTSPEFNGPQFISADVSIEMAYDDSAGASHYEPDNINTLSFGEGLSDSSGTC